MCSTSSLNNVMTHPLCSACFHKSNAWPWLRYWWQSMNPKIIHLSILSKERYSHGICYTNIKTIILTTANQNLSSVLNPSTAGPGTFRGGTVWYACCESRNDPGNDTSLNFLLITHMLHYYEISSASKHGYFCKQISAWKRASWEISGDVLKNDWRILRNVSPFSFIFVIDRKALAHVSL